MKKNPVYILGAGSSLLSLTDKEKNHISKSGFVLSFNKYLMFSDVTGIPLTHFLVGDHTQKSTKALQYGLDYWAANELWDTKFLINRSYTYQIERWFKGDRKLKEKLLKNTIFIRRYKWLEGGEWASSLDDKLFHFRGSLTGAINIADILCQGSQIRLLGVDLNDHRYFFQDEIDINPKYKIFKKRLTSGEIHETADTWKGKPGILSAFPLILKNVRSHGGDIVCCNPNSLLVTKNILKYQSILN